MLPLRFATGGVSVYLERQREVDPNCKDKLCAISLTQSWPLLAGQGSANTGGGGMGCAHFV